MRVIEAKVAEKSQFEQKKCIYLKQLVYQLTPRSEYNSYKMSGLLEYTYSFILAIILYGNFS
jgi:hypothetical protein